MEPNAASKEDGLAQQVSFEARYGGGLDRVLILGGGGIYFVAWQIAYLNALAKAGVDFGKADRVVGTSAGSISATIVSAKRLRIFAAEMGLLSRIPPLIEALAPAALLAPSQQRAVELFRAAQDAKTATVTAIGHAALAALTPSPQALQRSIAATISIGNWPSPNLEISTVDAFTGERLIMDETHGIPIARAIAASASVPGIFGPQPIVDRKCMDGGVSGTGIHSDRAAGAKRAMVVCLGAGEHFQSAGMTVTGDSVVSEMASLRASGTDVMVVGPASFDLEDLMNPRAVGQALKAGEEQAEKDLDAVIKFWEDA